MADKLINKQILICSEHSAFSVTEKNCESLVKERCLLCFNFRTSFCCQKCINIGNFSCSASDADSETFGVKRARMVALDEQRKSVVDKSRKIIDQKIALAKLPEEMEMCNERIRILKHLIQEKREAVYRMKIELAGVREQNARREVRLPRYRERVHKLATYVATSMRAEIADRRARLQLKRAALKKLVQKDIGHLVHYIFPITKVNPIAKSTDGDLEDAEMVTALAEASKTSFVQGTWVLMDSSGELQHRIVAPTLPASGDYSAFMAVQNENGVPLSEQIGSNEAYNVGAALCYTTQLVHLLAYYLDIILPKKVSYSDFSVRELTSRQFERKVARLNTNVLYLCFSQGMDSVLLNPRHTLNNLLNLVEHADLGQTGPFQVDCGLVLCLECDGDSRDADWSDEEEEDQFPWEWEAIPLVACPEGAPGPGAAMTNTQAATSIAGGLVTSLASMWKWAANK